MRRAPKRSETYRDTITLYEPAVITKLEAEKARCEAWREAERQGDGDLPPAA